MTRMTYTLYTSLLSDMQAILETRMNKYEYQMVDNLPDVRSMPERVFCGTFSYTTTRTRQRILVNNTTIYTLFNKPQTPAEAARDYLDVVFPKRLRCSSEQRNAYVIDKPYPLFYTATVGTEYAYMDIQAAFWSIMGLVGWDADYMPGKFLSPGKAPYDFPLPENKIARNCLVTAGGNASLTVWTGTKFIEDRPYNLHLNLGLHTLIADILHYIASEAIKCRAVYINTDGYIIPANQCAEFMARVSWIGLNARLKGIGETVVTGVGSYRVGEHKTKYINPDFQAPYSNLYPVDNPDMLRNILHRIAVDRVDRPYLFAV